MKRILIQALMLLACVSARAQVRVREYLETVTSSAPMEQAAVAVHAVRFGGDTVVSWNSSSMLVPASNMKLVSTGQIGRAHV